MSVMCSLHGKGEGSVSLRGDARRITKQKSRAWRTLIFSSHDNAAISLVPEVLCVFCTETSKL